MQVSAHHTDCHNKGPGIFVQISRAFSCNWIDAQRHHVLWLFLHLTKDVYIYMYMYMYMYMQCKSVHVYTCTCMLLPIIIMVGMCTGDRVLGCGPDSGRAGRRRW